MHFANAEYLNMLWGLPALGLLIYLSFRSRRRRLERVIGKSLRPRLTEEFSRGKAVLRAFFLMCFFAFAILAAARPQWGMRLETVHRRGVDIICALDTSFSMNAEDVAPSRLEKAKGEIRRLIQRSEGDRFGLVAFSGTAVVQCPLTLDQRAISLFLDTADAGMIEEPGTSLASAIEAATSAFVAEERKYKVLVFFTDGEDLQGQMDKAIRKAKEGGVIIYAVGIGTSQGTPIPIRDQKGDIVEYRKDPQGQVVISRLDERSLAEITAETGGRYFRATTSEGEIEELYRDLSDLEKKDLESKLTQNFEDQFRFPLALAIIFLFAELWTNEKRKPGATWLGKLHHSHQW
jgi:Ca-activated chloride channel family protein